MQSKPTSATVIVEQKSKMPKSQVIISFIMFIMNVYQKYYAYNLFETFPQVLLNTKR
jgi:hypothetical protein